MTKVGMRGGRPTINAFGSPLPKTALYVPWELVVVAAAIQKKEMRQRSCD